jgi:hypothetical protein
MTIRFSFSLIAIDGVDFDQPAGITQPACLGLHAVQNVSLAAVHADDSNGRLAWLQIVPHGIHEVITLDNLAKKAHDNHAPRRHSSAARHPLRTCSKPARCQGATCLPK